MSNLVHAEQSLEIQSFGVFKRSYDYATPASYIRQLEKIEVKQKDMIRTGRAAICEQQWIVEGSAEKGRKMAEEQIKLMLRAFNGECDAAIAKLKHNNYSAIENRIQKSFEALNKLGSTKQISITEEYLRVRLDELLATHELELAKEAERERQREVRERMREEEKALKEIENAKKKAEKDEATKAKALEDARKQLADEHGKHNAKLEQLIAKLEFELKDAIDRKAKAIARAQLTKSGHVYILSNVGTMGEGVYKIGMTRRLEPLDRVRELGDASVPFPFDVHALIYAEDAPKLENSLHRHFAERRLNLVNNRKEYFRVSLDEIREAVKVYFGEFTIRTDHEASQFRESLSLRDQGLAASIPVAEDDSDGEPSSAEEL